MVVETFSKARATCASWPTVIRSGERCRSMRMRLARAHEEGADVGECHEQDAEAGQVLETEDDARERQRETRPDEGASSRREQSSKRTHLGLTGCWTAPALPQQVGDDLGGRPPGELGLARGHEPVGQHGDGQRLDVVRDDVAPLEGGLGRAARSRCSPARGGPEAQRRRRARPGDEVDDVLPHGRAGVHLRHGGHDAVDGVGIRDRGEVLERRLRAVAVEQGQLCPGRRVPHRDPRHEAVPLGLGEG